MKKLFIIFAALAVTGTFWGLYYHGVAHFLGIDTQQSDNYDFVSGVGPMLVTAIGYSGVLGTVLRAVNCHTHGCWGIGRYPVAGGQFKVCRKHHREVTGHPHKLTIAVLRRLHLEHERPQPIIPYTSGSGSGYPGTEAKP